MIFRLRSLLGSLWRDGEALDTRRFPELAFTLRRSDDSTVETMRYAAISRFRSSSRLGRGTRDTLRRLNNPRQAIFLLRSHIPPSDPQLTLVFARVARVKRLAQRKVAHTASKEQGVRERAHEPRPQEHREEVPEIPTIAFLWPPKLRV